jgi:hypothetical protein
MGADFNIKAVGASVAAPFVAPAPQAAKTAVATQLPPRQTVTASDASVAAQPDPQADSGQRSQQVIIDRAAAEVVYRVVDNLTHLVVRQFPDEARLRARAYVRALDLAKQDRPQRSTDRQI